MGKTVRMSKGSSKSPYAARKRLRSSAQVNKPASVSVSHQSDEIIYQRVQQRDVLTHMRSRSRYVVGQHTSTQVTAQMTPEIRNEVKQTINTLINYPATSTSLDSVNERQHLNTESAAPKTSTYHYLCQNIVGTEEHVKSIRMMNTVRDNLQSDKKHTIITSGSFGEGLEMLGSDLDVMVVIKFIDVREDIHIALNADNIHFTLETEDTHPGFTKLRLLHSNDQDILEDCEEIGNDFFYSNLLFKERFSKEGLLTYHGPSLTDGFIDLVYCLHSKLWITPAKQWITRSNNNSWPSWDVKQTIVKHGVLFVPVGVKGSTEEELEWRDSFSVGEKLLIYSFTHTQLLCYSLMKILKDVIALDVDCKELLCSYFMKTVLFWICEELPLSIWRPENLISCFMACFSRLIYYVEYSVCPHYFIPENNLFENKIHGHAHKTLLNRLHILYSSGWQCILKSEQMPNFNALAFDIINESSCLHVKRVEKLLISVMFGADTLQKTFCFLLEKVIYKVLSSKSSRIKILYTYYLSKFCCKCDQLLPFKDNSGNKSLYEQDNTCISTLLLNTNHDTVSGWLLLASFFYRRKQYNTALNIVQYSLLKCSQEKLQQFLNLSDIHYDLFDLHFFRGMDLVQLWKCLLLDFVYFSKTSTLIPEELIQIGEECIIPPVVYAHFLQFLCHFHLKNCSQYRDSFRNIQLAIYMVKKNYVSVPCMVEGECYNIVGICFLLSGDKESARQAYIQSKELYPDVKGNRAFRMLSIIRLM
ncbi:uncharacterized protein LOC127715146 [Mytilus californianus]|uniref:uncharacterized protein LOC127715146 n=1 Tax=Mytilus californianus TaxID=6549 RepID=UPI002247B5B3|nr:uncharacterized protein LOC127715146 [Mytilus californianus]